MKHFKTILFFLAFAVLAPLGQAQDVDQAVFARTYDVASTSYIYCTTSDLRPGTANIETSGSSTTVTAVSGNPFESLAVGDDIQVTLAGVATRRRITAKASAVSITVDSAINLDRDNGYGFQWNDVTCGTAATNGWIPVAGMKNKAVHIALDTINATSIEWKIQGRIRGATAADLTNATSWTATNAQVVVIPEELEAIRVGVKVTTDGGAQSFSAHFQGVK